MRVVLDLNKLDDELMTKCREVCDWRNSISMLGKVGDENDICDYGSL